MIERMVGLLSKLFPIVVEHQPILVDHTDQIIVKLFPMVYYPKNVEYFQAGYPQLS